MLIELPGLNPVFSTRWVPDEDAEDGVRQPLCNHMARSRIWLNPEHVRSVEVPEAWDADFPLGEADGELTPCERLALRSGRSEVTLYDDRQFLVDLPVGEVARRVNAACEAMARDASSSAPEGGFRYFKEMMDLPWAELTRMKVAWEARDEPGI